MPIISRFDSIIIRMYYDEGKHHLPHFHAAYREEKVIFLIDPPKIIEGTMKRRAEKMIVKWATLHKAELLENYKNALQKKPLQKISPLE